MQLPPFESDRSRSTQHKGLRSAYLTNNLGRYTQVFTKDRTKYTLIYCINIYLDRYIIIYISPCGSLYIQTDCKLVYTHTISTYTYLDCYTVRT